MRLIGLLFFIVVSISALAKAEMYPFQSKGKWGYLNEAGEVAIAPMYDKANSFSDGLGCVRVNGYYGYINFDGSWAIKAIYDYAEPFYDGYAVVYLGATPTVIDKDGKTAFTPNYSGFFPAQLLFLAHHKDIAKRVNKLSRKRSFDGSLEPIGHHLSVTYNSKPRKIGLLAPNGKWLIKPKNLYDLELYNSDYFIITNSNYKMDTIDKFGNKVSAEGELKIKLTATYTYGPNSYFMRDKYYSFDLVDSNGNALSDKKFRQIAAGVGYGGELNNEAEIVYTYVLNEGWYAIDRTGKIVNGPISDISGEVQVGPVLLTTGRYNTDTEDLYGIWNGITNQNIEPIYDNIYSLWPGYQPKTVKLNGVFTFLDTLGNVVWQKVADSTLVPFNIDYINRASFYASSYVHIASLGGHGNSKNGLLATDSAKVSFPKSFSLQVSTDTAQWYGNVAGYKVYLANLSSDTIYFAAQDSRIAMLVQAQQENGQWIDIEYLPQSWCGNSYHTLAMPSGYYWQFVVPQYNGAIKTKLRLKCTYQLKTKTKETKTVYSNEWDASINPAQLWRFPGYTPSGLMDPYDN